MIGVSRERSRLLIMRAVSKPSMPGMRTSSRITAKSFLSARRSASSPDCAIIRFCPSVASSSCSANRLFGSSSTSRIFACGAGSACGSLTKPSGSAAARTTAAASDMPLSDELVTDGVVHERRVAREPELAQDARAIGTYRAGREAHLARDLADLLAGGEQPHHAVLAIRQFFMQRFLRIARAFRGENLRQRGAHVFAAVRHFAHRGGQFLRRAVLRDVAGAPCPQHARAMHVFGMHAEDQHRLARKFLLDIAQQIESAAAGHGKIEDRHVPLQLTRQLKRLVPIRRFPYYGRGGVRGKHLLKTVSHYRVVVSYENSHRHASYPWWFPCGRKV